MFPAPARLKLTLACRWLLGLFVALVSSAALPAHAEGSDPTTPAFLAGARDRALRNYGWTSEAMSYIAAHTRLVPISNGIGSACPTAVACTLPGGTVFLNTIPDDTHVLDYVLNHEFIHAMEYARGSSEGTIGDILADVLVLSNDASFPLAANAARRVLGLSGGDEHPVISGRDWFHIQHLVLEDVGWDVANLPGWYREAYFPYLAAAPTARRTMATPAAAQPRDADPRMQRVVDAIVSMCGPVLPGARVSSASVTCGLRPLWPGVPYPGMAGGSAPPPPRPLAPPEVEKLGTRTAPSSVQPDAQTSAAALIAVPLTSSPRSPVATVDAASTTVRVDPLERPTNKDDEDLAIENQVDG